MKNKQDHGKAKASAFSTEALSLWTTFQSNYSMCFPPNDWCRPGWFFWGKLKTSETETVLVRLTWMTYPLELARSTEDTCETSICLGSVEGRDAWGINDSTRHQGSWALLVVLSTEHNDGKWWINSAEPFLFLLPRLAIVFIVLTSGSFSET